MQVALNKVQQMVLVNLVTNIRTPQTQLTSCLTCIYCC